MFRLAKFLFLLMFSITTILAQADERLRNAIRSGDVEQVIQLSDTTAQINATTESGKTALMVLARAGYCDQVEKLLSMGADPDASNQNGGTPLMFATISGDLRCLTPLLDAGANVNARGINGWSALMIAAAKGNTAMTRQLIMAGADINARDVFLWTPLHRSAYENRKSVVDLLLSTPGVHINAQDDHGATALHHAAAMGYAEVVLSLLRQGALPDIPDMEGRTPLMYAQQQGHEALVEAFHGVNDYPAD